MMKAPLIAMLAALAVGLSAPTPADAQGDRDDRFAEQPVSAVALRFRSEIGGAFRPRSLTIRQGEQTVSSRLPAEVGSARLEDRMNLSSVPLAGKFFRGTLSTADARAGTFVGPLYRTAGDGMLIVAKTDSPVTGSPIAMTTNIPGRGAISYQLGRLGFAPAGAAPSPGAEIGAAWILDGVLVLASTGGEAAYPSIGALFEDLFQ